MFSKILLALQTDANQRVVVDPNQSLNSWLVIAGVLIIFACLLAAVIPSPLKEFTTKLQEFNFSKLGISMRVSILTVFVLMGFILSLSSFALQWRGYVKQAGESAAEIARKNGQIAELEKWKSEELARKDLARTFDMSILLKPRLPRDGTIDISKWSCFYRLDTLGKPSDPIRATIELARNGTYLRVFLDDITAETRLFKVELRNGTQSWVTENVNPLKDGIWEAELLDGGSHED